MPISFPEFLAQRGKLNADEQEMELLRKEHRRLYFKERHAERKRTHRRIELWFLKAEFAEFEAQAKYLDISEAELLKQYIRGRHQKQYVRTKDSRITELVAALNKWGSNLNQIAYKSNAIESLTDADVQELKALFVRMNQTINNELEHVPLETFIREQYTRNPRFLEYLTIIIESIKNQHSC